MIIRTDSCNPLVTVVIPSFNHQEYIGRCIESVIAQDYANIELLIIDDGSFDKSVDVIDDFIGTCEARFARFEFVARSNKGLACTLNEALSWARGKYLTTLASDDLIYPNKTSLLVEKIESLGEEYAAVFGDAIFIDEFGDVRSLPKPRHVVSSESETSSFFKFYSWTRSVNNFERLDIGSYESLLRGNYLPAMSCILRTEAIRSVGGWSLANMMEDWDLWLKLARSFKFGYVLSPVAKYRLHSKNSSLVFGKRLRQDSLKLLCREEEYSNGIGRRCEWSESYVNILTDMLINCEFYSCVKFMRWTLFGSLIKEILLRFYRRFRYS